MSLDLSKLQKLRRFSDGVHQSQCPACKEIGLDKSGNHLRIFTDGRFGCCMFPQDRPHRERVAALAKGEPGRQMPAFVPIDLPPRIDVQSIMVKWKMETSLEQIGKEASKLGVTLDSLLDLDCVYAAQYGAFAFPMLSGAGYPIGVRLRSDVRKWAVLGSKAGIFIPKTNLPRRVCFIPEGPTSLAACLSLGFYAIGRPSAYGGFPMICQAVKRLGVERCVIVADNDSRETPDGKELCPGVGSAESLQEVLPVPSVILVLSSKDARSYLQAGGTREMIESSLKSMVWKQPT